MQYLFILFLILLYTLQSIFCKLYNDDYPGPTAVSPNVFSIVTGFVAAFVVLASTGFSFSPKPLTLLFALINAVMLGLYDRFFILSADRGPYSVVMTSVIAGGIIIPMFARLIYAHDRPAWYRYVAVAVILVAAYLINKKTGESNVAKKGFYPCCAVIALTNGIYGTVLDLQQTLTGPEDKDELIIGFFFFMALGLTGITLCVRGKKAVADFRQTKKSMLWLVLSAAVKAGAILMLTFLIAYMDDVTLLYTFDNAGTLLFSALCAVFVLREKISVKNGIGIALMTAGLIIASV